MSQFIFLHNPRCSKSRAALALLEERGIQPIVRCYLSDPLSETELKVLAGQLSGGARTLVREGEGDYAAAGLSAESTDESLISAIARYPKLLQRPILMTPVSAVIGRPPEAVLALLEA